MLTRLLTDERISRSIDVSLEDEIIVKDIVEFIIIEVSLSKTLINEA